MLAPGPPRNKGIQDGGRNWSSGKYAPFELKLGTFPVHVHVRMPSLFQPDPSTFLCLHLGLLGTKESKMAAKMVIRKICSV